MKRLTTLLFISLLLASMLHAGDSLYVSVNGSRMRAVLEDNSSAKALAELIRKSGGSISVDMEDYASFEKVGSLPEALPRNDENITTAPGDIILYLGRRITIYYDTNEWSLTRLGRIVSVDERELRRILGKGNVTVTLSLE